MAEEASQVSLVVGLGNPGRQYEGTRHNVGYDVVDRLVRRWNAGKYGEKFHSWFVLTRFGGRRVALIKPLTFMNRSGQAVVAACRFFKANPASDLVVIVDDMALPLGRLRLRIKGSAGGHNGLQDILDRLGGDEWLRIRVGIGPSIGSYTGHVLSRFGEDERPEVELAVDRAAEAVECWLMEGWDQAMNRFNRPPEV